MMRFPTLIIAFFGSLILLPGCGNDGPQRAVVSGTVTLKGTPVEDGQIRYVPIEGTPGPITIAPIRQGKYRCDDKGGVPIGKQRVEIFAWDPKAPHGGRGEPSRPQWVPAKYNESSKLFEEVESSGDPLEKHFAL